MGVSGDQPLNIVTIHMVGRVILTNFKGNQKKHFGVRKSQKSSHPKFIRTSKVSASSLNNLFLTDGGRGGGDGGGGGGGGWGGDEGRAASWGGVAVDGGSVNAFLAAALTRVMRAAVPIPAVASASVLHSAAVGGSVVGVVGAL